MAFNLVKKLAANDPRDASIICLWRKALARAIQLVQELAARGAPFYILRKGVQPGAAYWIRGKCRLLDAAPIRLHAFSARRTG